MMNYDKKTKAELVGLLAATEKERDEQAATVEKLIEDLKRKTDELAEADRKLSEAVEAAEKACAEAARIEAEAEAMRQSKTEAMEAARAVSGAVLDGRTFALRAIIDLSCQDHCPHHRNPDACRNCEIRKRLDALEG